MYDYVLYVILYCIAFTLYCIILHIIQCGERELRVGDQPEVGVEQTGSLT